MAEASDRQIDLLSPAWHTDDPWPDYTWLREESPLYWDTKNELWAISRYEDIIFVSRQPEIFTSEEGNLPNMPPDPSMINQDGEAHHCQRALVSKGFLPSRIRRLEGYIREVAVGVIEGLKGRGEFNLVTDLAMQLPMRVIGEMIGLPAEDHARVMAWADAMVKGGCGPDYVTEEVEQAFAEFCEFHEALVAERSQNLGDDILSIWLEAEIDGKRLEEDQILFNHLLLFVGGSESTRSAISGGVEQLLKNPEQLAFLKEHPEAWQQAADEAIRWVTPFIRMVRTATRDVEMHGKTIREGEQVLMLYPPAVRDPRVYENPEVFDVRLKRETHPLSFGYGTHFCLGAPLARMEARVVLQELFDRIPDLALHPDKRPEFAPSSFLRGLKSLPVVFEPQP